MGTGISGGVPNSFSQSYCISAVTAGVLVQSVLRVHYLKRAAPHRLSMLLTITKPVYILEDVRLSPHTVTETPSRQDLTRP